MDRRNHGGQDAARKRTLRKPVHADTAPGGLSLSPAPEPAGPDVRIAVLGGFDLWIDKEPVPVPVGSERVLAFIALCCRATVPRSLIAGTLWPGASEHCAHANLRSALSRLHSSGRQALDIRPAEVRLVRGAVVDLHSARELAQRVLTPTDAARAADPDLIAVEDLSAELLPGWYDDWALLEAEEWRQLRLHALETLAERCIAVKRYGAAVAAAQAAVRADPLRESGQAALIRAHLAEGNPSEALRDFAGYSERLRDELGLEPSPHLQQLIAGISTVTPR